MHLGLYEREIKEAEYEVSFYYWQTLTINVIRIAFSAITFWVPDPQMLLLLLLLWLQQPCLLGQQRGRAIELVVEISDDGLGRRYSNVGRS